MEILGAAAILAVALVAVAALARGGRRRAADGPEPGTTEPTTVEREKSATVLEERLRARAEELDARARELDEQTRALEAEREQLALRERDHESALERISGLSAAQAKERLLRDVEDKARHDAARRLRQIEEETKRDAERRVRSILAVAMQRLAASHAAETTVSVVQLPSDDMKGRIIGREGRNIRALENLTGVDFIIDDTPNAVVLSGFDGVRREIARMTLEKLLQDGRIHPARIEETYYQAQVRARRPHHEGGRGGGLRGQRPGPRRRPRQDARPAEVPHELRAERARALRRVREPRGDDGRRARRERASSPGAPRCCTTSARPSSHEVEGPHALVGGELARRHGEPEAVAHAMEAHHNEVEPQTIEAVIVQSADALSGARPGRPRRVARAVRQAPARPRADRDAPRGRGEGLRDAGRPRDPRHGRRPTASTTTRPCSCPARSRATSSASSSTRGRSR